MFQAAEKLEFERAAELRDQIDQIKELAQTDDPTDLPAASKDRKTLGTQRKKRVKKVKAIKMGKRINYFRKRR